jgi:hypothetical protein
MKTLRNTLLTGLLLALPCHAQNKIAVMSVGSKCETVVIDPIKMNVLYIGLDNPLAISTGKKRIISEIENGTVEKDTSGIWIARVKCGPYSVMEVYESRNGEKGKLLGIKQFRVKAVPTPKASVLGKHGDVYMKKEELLAADKVMALFENFDFDLKLKVLSFDVEGSCGGDIRSVSTSGDSFSIAQKHLIGSIKNGRKVYISNVRACMPDGTTRTIPGISIKLLP